MPRHYISFKDADSFAQFMENDNELEMEAIEAHDETEYNQTYFATIFESEDEISEKEENRIDALPGVLASNFNQ